ncbi:MAG TPA: aminotransferase class I/II-fold pyridoxal phosphate-dependent enzyme [Pseudonocardiaceae bacterium]|nr:aminotransferase class I/II-fold pyridoxal phosphate-dependent enzyme [Pseudonocardiaceae bacterium]
MVEQMIARRAVAVQQALHSYFDTVVHSPPQSGRPFIADFMSGDPHELPPQGFVEALRQRSIPTSRDWFAYCFTHEPARQAAATSLTAELGAAFAAEDIFLTRGAGGAIALALLTVVDPGDEVVFLSPPWFFYEAMIVSSGATPVRVRLQPPNFDLDIDAIAAALGPRTRAVLINTPHNPTGRIYPAATLQRLADTLAEAARHYDRPIWVISDEAYSRILFDERSFVSPGSVHPYSMLARTYSKSTLAPGQRLGYLALAPGPPQTEPMRKAVFHALLSSGLAMPDAVMQYALPEIDGLLISVAAIQRRRDRMVAALREQGYQLHSPEATFYLLLQAPQADDRAFCALLAEQGIAVLPGHVIELPGYFRISLTATDEMVERSLPIFAQAIQHANSSRRS